MRSIHQLGLFVLLFLGLAPALHATGPDGIEVKLIYAEGRIYYHEIFVQWSTEWEKAPCDFVIEASADGQDWRIRGRVKSKGNSSRHSEYKFVDKKDDTFHFYRIRQMDKRGSSEILSEFELENYSIEVDLEALEFDDSRRLVLEYSIDKDQELMIRIYNSIGEQVMTKVMPFKKAGDYIYHLDISDLRRDSYLLQVTQILLDKTVAEAPFKTK